MNPGIVSYGDKAAQAVWRLRRLPVIAEGLKVGAAYRQAAARDEKNGLPFTAAAEWQRAAELLSPIPHVSDRCWQEWERIMHLPRRFAVPII
jgi:hypothetical protein